MPNTFPISSPEASSNGWRSPGRERPVFLLADEPTGNLDTRTSVEVMGFFQKFHAQGKTVVLVTHEFDISQYTERIITFRDGRIISDVANPNPRNAAEDLKKLPRLDDEPLEAS